MSDLMEKEIKRTFVKLLNEKPLNKITIKDITSICGVNRNSFYYHFKDIPDLLEQVINDDADEFISRYPNVDSIDELLMAVYTNALEKRNSALNIFDSLQGRYYERYVFRVCEDLTKKYLKNSVNKNISEQDQRIIEKYLSFTLLGASISWATRGMPEEEIESVKRAGEMLKIGFNKLVSDSTEKI